MLIFTTDKPRLQHHFEKDKVLFSYHLGDLDDFYWDNCQWAVDYADRARIEECILIYTGCKVPSIMAFGVSERFDGLLEQMIPLMPPKFYCHFFKNSRKKFLDAFKESSLGSFYKMQLQTFHKVENKDGHNIVQLDKTHIPELESLYERAYPENYFIEKMLETGKYYGVIIDNKIVSVTGVHVDSDKYKVAVLGNITTDPEYRGKGLATIVTSHLLEKLTADEKLVCLNVRSDNPAAIASYKKLGFVKVHDYEESLFELK
ncbi:MAG: GNAT family N-acetyltransferase [Calditrichaeota bacterium]|nr:MAG: GNAT family N-acetyltransferase [Calditrichota bacterium]